MVMWFLVWMQFLNGTFTYYQIGTYGSEEMCELEKTEASVIITNNNSAVHCLYTNK